MSVMSNKCPSDCRDMLLRGSFIFASFLHLLHHHCPFVACFILMTMSDNCLKCVRYVLKILSFRPFGALLAPLSPL